MIIEQVQMTNEEYHADETAISSSGIKLIHSATPKHFWASYRDPDRAKKESTPAMEFGTLTHTLILEPEKKNETIKVTRSKVLKDFEQCESVAKSILELDDCILIRKRIGIPEFTVFWDEDVVLDDGSIIVVRCKARLDWFTPPMETLPSGVIFDVKTTKDAGEDFFKDAYNLGYHIQAANNCRAIQLFYNLKDLPPFFFLVGEKQSPYCSASYECPTEYLKAGMEARNKALKKYAECTKSGIWYGYSKTTQQMKLPKWAKENYV